MGAKSRHPGCSESAGPQTRNKSCSPSSCARTTDTERKQPAVMRWRDLQANGVEFFPQQSTPVSGPQPTNQVLATNIGGIWGVGRFGESEKAVPFLPHPSHPHSSFGKRLGPK
eukprot:546597-Amphidinium_carterae.1